MKTNRKQTKFVILLIVLLAITLGYAALATTLKIDGTVNVAKTTWDVHFENVQITEGSVTANPAPTTNNTDTTEMTYTINFTKPGDYFEFTTDIVNDGTIDAMVDIIDNKTYASNGTTEITLPTYLTNTVTYDGGKQIKQNQELKHGTSKKIKVRVEFKKDIQVSELPSDGDTTIVFKFKGDFKQADENAIKDPVSFATDSWETIADNTTSSLYQLGDTKTIQMDVNEDGEDETYHLRIVNKNSCSTTVESESACDLVLEFVELLNITNNDDRKMNLTDTSSGGWRDCKMRSYLNTTIYNKLPNSLKSIIKITKVISGHERYAAANYETSDYLYIASPIEVGITSATEDTGVSSTKMLEFYEQHNYDGERTKKMAQAENSSDWWLRSALNITTDSFYNIGVAGRCYAHNSTNTYGVAPLFRIG